MNDVVILPKTPVREIHPLCDEGVQTSAQGHDDAPPNTPVNSPHHHHWRALSHHDVAAAQAAGAMAARLVDDAFQAAAGNDPNENCSPPNPVSANR
ncbi:MAG: hypothetical protein CL920_31610 [Deltaproteobacteria bacterium]|nr:hypothetical protein [Deltaproteobacteria bacterium]